MNRLRLKLGLLFAVLLAVGSGESQNVFLKGKYVEVGVHPSGSFGSSVDAPSSYHARGANGKLGFVCDVGKEGWNTGTPGYVGDYFVPGDPEEGWGIQWQEDSSSGTVRRFNNFGLNGLHQVSKISHYKKMISNGQQSEWLGSASDGTRTANVFQTVTLDTFNTYFTISVLIQNTGSDTLFGLKYFRNVDPDNEQPLTNSYTTKNYIDFQPGVGGNTDKAVVVAEGLLYGVLHDWESADEPWQFLAACDEYYHCVLVCDRHFTSLPVATDATCSGLQILAGLARDKNTAKLVNVLPSDRPQDAYKVVAEAATPYCPKSIRPYMDRKTVKRVVMTVPYNAKPFSNRGYIKEALAEKGIEIDKDDLTKTVVAVRNAMDEVVPGPMAVMSWIESEVAKAIDRGETELTWTTPSGFVVTQKLMKKEVVTVKLQLLGRCELEIATNDSDKVDKQHHKNATAPNLIHSLDASLLHFSALAFDAPIALIHDSVLCRATDMSSLSTIVRETYMHLFAEHDYLQDFANQIGAETDPPIIGDLQPESVIESTYFFC